MLSCSPLPSKDPRIRFHGCQFAPHQTDLTKKSSRRGGEWRSTLSRSRHPRTCLSFFGINAVCCRTRAQQRLSFYLICTSVQLSAWLLPLVQSPKNIIDAAALPTGKFLRVFTKLPIKCSLNINWRVNKCWKLTDCLESFRTVWKVSG